MIRPVPQARRCGSASRLSRSGPFTFTAHIWSSAVSSASVTANFGLIPAAFTSPCTAPNRSAVAATNAAALSVLSAS